MEILRVIARLLDYPSCEAAKHSHEFVDAIRVAKEIPPNRRQELIDLVEDIYARDLLDAQECYTGLFEQGRSLSLHLFEHVHGESRDRGQAMVDLMEEYSSHGFEIDARELPDYIPLFLEYLSFQPDLKAREWLADTSHILAVLGARLTERGSGYGKLFESLLIIAGRVEELQEQLVLVANEEPDNTPEALDKEWEEVAVTFSAADQICKSNIPTNQQEQVRPLIWSSQTP